MRISDWSSDVCSSDLAGERPRRRAAKPYQHGLTCHLAGGKALMQAPLVLRAAIVLRELGKLAAGGQRQCPAGQSLEGPVAVDQLRLDRAVAPHGQGDRNRQGLQRSEEHTSELQSLMRISYAVFCLKK